MNTINYRVLNIDECQRIREIDPSQYINRAWREENGNKKLIEIDYHEPDFPNGFENHLNALLNTIKSGGVALGAFCNERIVGFCSVNRDLLGEKHKYVLLDQLFISKQFRNKGIGKKLFFMAVKEAKNWRADKFYICAGSAEETIAFYFALGCEEAKEIIEELYQNDPRDYQLEFDFNLL